MSLDLVLMTIGIYKQEKINGSCYKTTGAEARSKH